MAEAKEESSWWNAFSDGFSKVADYAGDAFDTTAGYVGQYTSAVASNKIAEAKNAHNNPDQNVGNYERTETAATSPQNFLSSVPPYVYYGAGALVAGLVLYKVIK